MNFAGLFAGSYRIHAIRRAFSFDGMAPAARRDCPSRFWVRNTGWLPFLPRVARFFGIDRP